MTRGSVRHALVRAGGALQLAAFSATAASFVATLGGTLWRQSRPGCVVDGSVYCTTSSVDVAARWPAVVAGVVLALVVAGTTGRVHRAVQVLVLLVVASGTAVFTADQSRYGSTVVGVCRIAAAGECAFPAWHLHDLVVGAGLGVALGLLTLGCDRASRRARAVGPLGVRRVAANVLVVGSVPFVLAGLLAVTGTSGEDRAGAVTWLTSSLAAFALGQVLRLRSPRTPVSSADAKPLR